MQTIGNLYRGVVGFVTGHPEFTAGALIAAVLAVGLLAVL